MLTVAAIMYFSFSAFVSEKMHEGSARLNVGMEKWFLRDVSEFKVENCSNLSFLVPRVLLDSDHTDNR